MQQQLAKLQMTLEETHDNFAVINKIRQQADEDYKMMQAHFDEKTAMTADERLKVERFQLELDKLNGTLKQIEAYNEQMKNEIAVTRRATYVAEESVSKLEKEKKDQDVLIDNLQEQLKQSHQQLALYEAQLVAQRRETKAAKETLAEAESEMESINFEKKQLVQQWKSSIIGMTRRDEALKATEDALHKQTEQERAIAGEIEGYKRDIKSEQQKNEKLTQVLNKVQGEAEFLEKNIVSIKEKRDKLAESYAKLQRSLEATEEKAERAATEKTGLEGELLKLDKEIVKVSQKVQEIDDDILVNLSDQTTAEKTANKTVRNTQKIREQIRDEEMQSITLQNELAKVRVDILNTQAHNGKLKDTLVALDEDLKEKGKIIEKYEVEIRRRNDEIEKRTNEVDRLNRQFDKLTSNMEDENTGPLEATIVNLQREIAAKEAEGKDLQRRWLGFHTELVALMNENNTRAEQVQRLKSEHTVLTQKRTRLDVQYTVHQKEIKELDTSVLHMHNTMTRLNQLISENGTLQETLANDNFNLENNIVSQLQELESEAAKLESKIAQCGAEKRDIMAEMVEIERQIMLWERKIQLEKETQAALDPDVGTDVIAAMKKEIHRMKLRHSELLRRQEKLIQDMEKSIYKRETMSTKGQAQSSKKTPELTEAGLRKACAELRRSIRETENEAAASESRVQELTEQRSAIGAELEEVGSRVKALKGDEEASRQEVGVVESQRNEALLKTTQMQRMAKRYKDLEAGKAKGSGVDPGNLPAELDKSAAKLDKLSSVIGSLLQEQPHLEQALEKTVHVLKLSEAL